MQHPRDQMRFSVTVSAHNETAYLGPALDSLRQRPAFGMAPAFRQERRRTFSPAVVPRRVVLGILLVGLTSLGFATGAGPEAVDGLANLWQGP